MLQTKPLQDLLSQALSLTIHTAVIATAQGTLIAHAVNTSQNTSSQSEGPRRQAQSLAAIANVVWKNYANIKNIDHLWDVSNGTPNREVKEGLVWTSVDCEVILVSQGFAKVQNGRLLLYQIPSLSATGLLLALSGTKDAHVGMMRTKVGSS